MRGQLGAAGLRGSPGSGPTAALPRCTGWAGHCPRREPWSHQASVELMPAPQAWGEDRGESQGRGAWPGGTPPTPRCRPRPGAHRHAGKPECTGTPCCWWRPGQDPALLCCAVASSAVTRRQCGALCCPSSPRGRVVEGRATLQSAWGRAGEVAGRASPCLCPSVINPPLPSLVLTFTRLRAGSGHRLAPWKPRWVLQGPGAFSPRLAPPCTQPPEALPLRSLHGFPTAPAPRWSLTGPRFPVSPPVPVFASDDLV